MFNTDITVNRRSVASGSMLILALAYTQKSGDKNLIFRYYILLLKWAEFLVKHSLDPSGLCVANCSLYVWISSMTADGSRSAMSNLALKGITGIYAMGKINQLLEGYIAGANANRTSYYLVSYGYPSLLHYSSIFLTNNLYAERLVTESH